MKKVIFCAENALKLIYEVEYDVISGLDMMNVKGEDIIYDSWVLRDINGSSVSKMIPNIKKGDLFQVYCTWGGMVSLNRKKK